MSFLKDLVSIDALRLLHLRRSGKDMPLVGRWHQEPRVEDVPIDLGDISQSAYDLAQWVFGPEGCPNLQILAFGDASYNNRFNFYYGVFCRKVKPEKEEPSQSEGLNFRRLTRSDHGLWETLQENMGFFTACPTDSLFEYPE